MKVKILLPLLFINFFAYSQEKLKLYDFDDENEYYYYMRGETLYKCAVSNYNVKTESCSKEIDLNPDENKTKVVMRFIDDKIMQAKFIGTIKKTGNFNPNYIYDLPYLNQFTFKIEKGYNARHVHDNLNALDFDLPEGTEILAAREGRVIFVEDSNKYGCPNAECSKFTNMIQIIHDDGSFAMYTHLQNKSAAVKVGQRINKGDFIALSGNTGWSYRPGLHFVVYDSLQGNNSVKTLFRTKDGNTVEYLQEGKSYYRKY